MLITGVEINGHYTSVNGCFYIAFSLVLRILVHCIVLSIAKQSLYYISAGERGERGILEKSVNIKCEKRSYIQETITNLGITKILSPGLFQYSRNGPPLTLDSGFQTEAHKC